MQHDHKATEHRPSDPFDKLLSSMIGLPNGAHTQPTVIQHIDFYGNTTSYMIQTARTDEALVAFVTQVDASGSKRYTLPLPVLAVIDRQREAITKQLRRRNGRRIAEDRKARGEKSAFMKTKRRGK
jgi:phage gp36-like protein